MPYQSETIQTIISRINTQYFLPAIQRNYRWGPDKVMLLLDSVLRGYPISSFLFWSLEEDNRKNWEIYKFCETAYSGGTRHNKLPAVHGSHDLILVLDGQQRLTSLYIALKGIYKIRRRGQWSNWPEYYPEHRLYLDLLAAANETNDDDEVSTIEPYYTLKFFEGVPTNQPGQFWLPVGRILDCNTEDKFYSIKRSLKSLIPLDITSEQEDRFEQNLDRLYHAIWHDLAISYYVERNQDYDRVLDIFVRANEGGTPLTSDEIILSMFESKWSDGAKEKIYTLIDQANNHLPARNEINQRFVMRTCLVLADMPVRYMVKNFTNQHIELIEALWPSVEDAILRTLTLVNKLGFDNSNFRRLNLLIPVVYYMFLNPGVSFLESTEFQVQNASRIRRWLIVALLNNVLGERQQQSLANLRNVLKKYPAGSDFPIEALNAELERMHFYPLWDDRAIHSYLNSQYQVDFLKLSLMYDERFWHGLDIHQDHIFPSNLFNLDNPAFATLPREKQERFLSLKNNLANLELLLSNENLEKQAKPFDQWIATRDRGFRQRHLIPDDDHLLQFENFDQFITAREELIKARLQRAI